MGEDIIRWLKKWRGCSKMHGTGVKREMHESDFGLMGGYV